jgi:hypothetical protein
MELSLNVPQINYSNYFDSNVTQKIKISEEIDPIKDLMPALSEIFHL